MNNNLITTYNAKEYLNRASNELSTTTNKNEINNIIENLVKNVTGAEYSSLWIYDNDKSFLFRERKNDTPKTISIESKKGLLYSCFACKKTIVTNHLASEKNYVVEIDNPDKIRMKSKIMIPLLDDDVFLGIITAYSSFGQMKKFDTNDLELFNAIIPFVVNATYKIRTEQHSDSIIQRSTDSRSNLNSITQQRKSLQTSQELIDYVANVVHDIRTPSNGLYGFLDILEEQIHDERLKEYISHAKESAQLISDMTTSILESVTLRRDISQSKNETVSPFKYFGSIANIFSSIMYQKQINYNIYIDPSLPKEIEVQSIKLKRAIMNLLGNANKFTTHNETIEFSVIYKKKNKRIYIFVKDSGIGIAKEKQEEIFEVFKQAEDNTKQNYGGTGLGLAISASYIKELGGKLCVDSELDKGSTFYFDIPSGSKNEELKFTPIENKAVEVVVLMETKNNFVANNITRYLMKMGVDRLLAVGTLGEISKTTTHLIVFESMLSLELFEFVKSRKIELLAVEEKFLNLEKENLEGASLISQYEYFAKNLYNFVDDRKTPRILVVDDDQISVSLIKVILENELCNIDIAHDGQEGLDFLIDSINSNRPYSLLYSDANMPVMSGKEMIQKYKEYARKKGITTILTVSISGDLYEKGKSSEEFDLYIGKPFKKENIKSVFHKSIQKRSI